MTQYDDQRAKDALNAAFSRTEQLLRRALRSWTIVEQWPTWPASFRASRNPVLTLGDIVYRDADGNDVTAPPGSLIESTDGMCVIQCGDAPSGIAAGELVDVNYTAGYAGEIPEEVRQGILLFTELYFGNQLSCVLIESTEKRARQLVMMQYAGNYD